MAQPRQDVIDVHVSEEKGKSVKFALIRRDPATLFVELKPWIEKNLEGCTEIIQMCMTTDNGNLTIAILYRT